MHESGFTVSTSASRGLRLVLIVAHGLAMAAIALIALAWVYQVVMLAMVVFSLYKTTPPEIGVQLRCDPDGQLLIAANGGWHAADVLPDTTVLAWLVVLRYRRHGKRFADTSLILADSVQCDDFRRLRVWLRWQAAAVDVVPE